MLTETLLPVKELYYDENFKPARTIIFPGMKELGGQVRPVKMRAVPSSDKPNGYTEIVYQVLELDIPLGDRFFPLTS